MLNFAIGRLISNSLCTHVNISRQISYFYKLFLHSRIRPFTLTYLVLALQSLNLLLKICLNGAQHLAKAKLCLEEPKETTQTTDDKSKKKNGLGFVAKGNDRQKCRQATCRLRSTVLTNLSLHGEKSSDILLECITSEANALLTVYQSRR